MRIGFMLIGIALSATAAVAQNITIVEGEVDVRATSTSGRQGSSSGVIVDDPNAVRGTTGNLTDMAGTVAGPVAPGDIPTLPGTSGVSTANAVARLDLTQLNEWVTRLGSSITFTNMDNGVYSANAASSLRVEFTVAEDTAYAFAGIYQVAPSDLTWKIQLGGPGGFLVNNATTSDDAGSVDFSGTLQANTTYTLVLNITVNRTLATIGDDSDMAMMDGIFTLGCSSACNVSGGDADVDDDCDIDLSDLAKVLANFGLTGATHGDGDTDFDGDVDLTDLANVLALFGTTCV